MTKTVSLELRRSRSLFDRLASFFAQLLDRQAEIAAHNCEAPYFGL